MLRSAKRIFSGIQPTSDGVPHLGNYLGALQHWRKLQHQNEKSDLLFSIVDYHAITMPYDAKLLKNNCYTMLASFLSIGLDPEKCIIFQQSHVQYHAELMWLLSTLTPLAELQRMTQYKSKKENATVNLGLLSYPVLMASDILLYHARYVPVGEDQTQHLELTRTLASLFNKRYATKKEPYFVLPKGMYNDTEMSKIQSLKDPSKKMSKSDAAKLSCIYLTDTADEIHLKIKKATTDSIKHISYDPVQRPGLSNLIHIHAGLLESSDIEAIVSEYAHCSIAQYKSIVSDIVISKIVPMGRKLQLLKQDQMYLNSVLTNGAINANEIAATTMSEVKSRMGF